MVAISTGKVNARAKRVLSPAQKGLKLIIFRCGAADTLELTSWKITFNVPSFDFAQIGAFRNARSGFFDIRYALK